MSYFRLAEFDAAEATYLTALEARRRLGDRWMEARSLRALGSTYSQVGQYRKSLAYYEDARDVIEYTSPEAGGRGGHVDELARIDATDIG